MSTIETKTATGETRRASSIKDSGSKREFETGAHRDNATGKGRCDLLPLRQVSRVMQVDGEPEPVLSDIAAFMETLDKKYLEFAIQDSLITCPVYENSLPNMMLEVSKLYEDGALKYGENNWSATCL